MYMCIRKSVSVDASEQELQHFQRDYPLAYGALVKLCEERMNSWELSEKEIGLHDDGLQSVFEKRCDECEQLVQEQKPGSLKHILRAFRSMEVTRDIYAMATHVWNDREIALSLKPDAAAREEDWINMVEKCDLIRASVNSL